MKASAKKLLEQIVLQELDLLHEQLWGDNGIGPKEKKQFVDKLKTMFSCLYDDLYNNMVADVPLTPQVIVDKLFDTILDTDKYQDYNYNIRCYGKGHVYELVTNELNKDSGKNNDPLLFQSELDPNGLIMGLGNNFRLGIRGTITDWYGQQIKQPYYSIRNFPDRRSFTMNPLSFLKMWAGPGGVSADKIITQLKRLSEYYDIEQVQKHYKISKNGNVVFASPFAISTHVPKLKRGSSTAKENNLLYLIQNTDIIKLIKSKTSISERFKVVSYITSNILTNNTAHLALTNLFDKDDRVDAMQVMSLGDATQGSMKDISDLGGPPDQETLNGYNAMFGNVPEYKSDMRDYGKSYREMLKDPYGKGGRMHLYNYNMFRGYDEHRHEYNLAAGILAGFIPYAGPIISSAIFGADAEQYFDEGDSVGGTISAVFAILPFIRPVAAYIPGIREIGPKAMFALSEKLLSNSSKVYLTQLEKEILQGLAKYSDKLGKDFTNAVSRNAAKILDYEYSYIISKTGQVVLSNGSKIPIWLYRSIVVAAKENKNILQLTKMIAPYFALNYGVVELSTTDWWKEQDQKISDERFKEAFIEQQNIEDEADRKQAEEQADLINDNNRKEQQKTKDNQKAIDKRRSLDL